MLRIIKESRPTWVIGENVAGFISMALDDVLFDLEGEGYETQSFVIPACAVGGIHRRDRVWIIAYSEHNGASSTKKHRGTTESISNNKEGQNKAQQFERVCASSNVAYSYNERLQRKPITSGYGSIWARPHDKQSSGRGSSSGRVSIGIPTQPAIRSRDDGLPDNMARLKALGNAVVPQIPEAIGRAIMAGGLSGEGSE